jgi:hypothetical protein
MESTARKRLTWICAIGTVLLIPELVILAYYHFQSDTPILRHVQKTTRLGPDTVVVMVLNLSLPDATDERSAFLWNTFSEHPAERGLSACTSDVWQYDFEVLSNAMVRKAEAQKLNSDSLRKSLVFVLNNSNSNNVFIPEAAYQITFDGKPIWVITLKWETQCGWLGHIRAFAIDQETIEQLGFMTCG